MDILVKYNSVKKSLNLSEILGRLRLYFKLKVLMNLNQEDFLCLSI